MSVDPDTLIRLAVETITPAMAREYLGANVGNRQCGRGIVAKYARAIARGEWKLNGETIKFAKSGKLLDGQHRLRAIVAANVAIRSCVVRGLPDDTFKTLDQGKTRSGGDCLYILKYRHPNALAAAGRALFCYEMEWTGAPRHFRGVSNDELLATIARHPGLIDAGHEFMKRPQYTSLIPNSIGMFTYYLAKRVNAGEARRFFLELSSARFENPAPDYPPRVLRAMLVKTSKEIIKPNSTVKLAWVIEAWNAYINGKPLKRLSRIVEKLQRFSPDPVQQKPQRRAA